MRIVTVVKLTNTHKVFLCCLLAAVVFLSLRPPQTYRWRNHVAYDHRWIWQSGNIVATKFVVELAGIMSVVVLVIIFCRLMFLGRF